MTYEEFTEIKQTAEKALAELNLYERAIKRVYGEKAFKSLIETYKESEAQDARSKMR